MVIDLKMQPFRPEFAGKMNLYVSAVNELLRHPDDQPSIGLILCKTRDRFVAEYARRDVSKPFGISGYQLAAALLEKLKGTLPTIEEIKSELSELRMGIAECRCRTALPRALIGTMSAHIRLLQIRDSWWRKRFAR